MRETGRLTADGKRVLGIDSDITDLCEFVRSTESPNVTSEVYVNGERCNGTVSIEYPGAFCPGITPDSPHIELPLQKTSVSLHDLHKKRGYKGKRQVKKTDRAKKVQKATSLAQREIEKDFNRWKNELCDMIRNDSSIEQTGEDELIYLLPRKLVELVWTTTIHEFVKMEEQENGIEGAAERASSRIKGRLQALADQMVTPEVVADEETQN